MRHLLLSPLLLLAMACGGAKASATPAPAPQAVQPTKGLKRTFGAVGDNVTDDTQALQAAAASGEDVEVEPGTYRYTTGLMLTNGQAWEGHHGQSFLNYLGNGDAITIQGATPYKRHALASISFKNQATPNSFVKVALGNNTTLRDLSFEYCGGIATKAIWNVASYGLSIQKCNWSFYTGTPIYLSQSANDATFSYSVSISDTDISNIAGTGVIAEGGGAITLSATTIEGCSAGGVLLASGWVCYPIKFSGCYFESNQLFDIRLDSDTPGSGLRWARASLDSCRFNNSPSAGIQFNGKGNLVARDCAAVSSLHVTQLNPVNPDQAHATLDQCLNMTVTGANLQ